MGEEGETVCCIRSLTFSSVAGFPAQHLDKTSASCLKLPSRTSQNAKDSLYSLCRTASPQYLLLFIFTAVFQGSRGHALGADIGQGRKIGFVVKACPKKHISSVFLQQQNQHILLLNSQMAATKVCYSWKNKTRVSPAAPVAPK